MIRGNKIFLFIFLCLIITNFSRSEEKITTSPARTPSQDHSGRDKKPLFLRVVLTEERLHFGLYLFLWDVQVSAQLVDCAVDAATVL